MDGRNVTLKHSVTLFSRHLAEVHDWAVDIDPPVLLVPLDAVEVAAPRLVDGAPQGDPGPWPRLDLVPEAGTCQGHVTRGKEQRVEESKLENWNMRRGDDTIRDDEAAL